MVLLARMQGIEISDAVDTEHDRFAIDHELALLVPQRGLDDPGIAAAPVVAVPAEQAHALALALNVIFDFVNPGGRRGDARA